MMGSPRLQNPYKRSLDKPSVREMMAGAIDDDQSSLDVIDFAVHGFGDFVVVT